MDTELTDYRQSEASDEREAGKISKIKTFEVGIDQDGERLDKVLASNLPEVSRSRLKTLIEEGSVQVNGEAVIKPRHKMVFSDSVRVELTPRAEDLAFKAVPMDLDIVYEDEDILVINKPAGLVVHPAAGTGTIHFSTACLPTIRFSNAAACGYRAPLDRDTTGLMVVAKNENAQLDLVRQLQERTVKREYWALTRGIAPKDKVIDSAIERDPRNPLRFSVGAGGRAKPASTHIKCIQSTEIKGKPFSWVACRLKTGRTHQIRVHMESIGFPLIGDPLYRNKLPKPKEDGSVLNSFNRQALHASRLGLIHPRTGEPQEWFAEPPQDFIALMEELQFGPWDEPSQVFGDPVWQAEEETAASEEIGRISSWDDFDFGDEEEDSDLWKIERTNE